jgi:hypothetical protein
MVRVNNLYIPTWLSLIIMASVIIYCDFTCRSQASAQHRHNIFNLLLPSWMSFGKVCHAHMMSTQRFTLGWKAFAFGLWLIFVDIVLWGVIIEWPKCLYLLEIRSPCLQYDNVSCLADSKCTLGNEQYLDLGPFLNFSLHLCWHA